MKKTGKAGDTPHYVKIPLGIGNGGNGDLKAQEKAYEAFAEHIRDKTGTKIYMSSRLD